MKRYLLLAVLLSLGICKHAFAGALYPPPTLRQIVKGSDNIIIGRVVDTFQRAAWGSMVARIALLDQLKGVISDDTIEVAYTPGAVCPPSAEYFPNTYVLAFLDVYKGIFLTYADGIGSKTLERKQIEVYKTRIEELQVIQKITDSSANAAASLEWLVKCIDNNATFWDGAMELIPPGDNADSVRRMFSSVQLKRIKTGVLANGDENEYGLGYGHFNLIDVIYADNEKEVDSFLWEKLKKLPDEQVYLAYEYMTRLKHLDPSPKMAALMTQYAGLPWHDHNRQKELTQQFIKLVEQRRQRTRAR